MARRIAKPTRRRTGFFADSKAEELAFWQDKLALTQAGSKEQLAVENNIYQLERQLAVQNERDILASLDADEKVTDATYARSKAAIQEEAELGKISASEEVARLKDLLDTEWALEQDYYEKKLAAAVNDVRTREPGNHWNGSHGSGDVRAGKEQRECRHHGVCHYRHYSDFRNDIGNDLQCRGCTDVSGSGSAGCDPRQFGVDVYGNNGSITQMSKLWPSACSKDLLPINEDPMLPRKFTVVDSESDGVR